MAVICPVCHQPIYEGSAYCSNCGAQSPRYGVQSPRYGAQSPNYGAQSPRYGAQSPNYGAQSPNYEEFVDSPPEGYVAPDPTNPYAAPQVDNSPVYMLDWKRLASSLKMMNVSFFILFLFNVGFIAFGFLLRRIDLENDDHSAILGLCILAMIGFVYIVKILFLIGVVRTAGALDHSVIARLLWAICALLVPLVPLLILGIKSNNRFRAAGFRPGFLYPDFKQFERLWINPDDTYPARRSLFDQ